MKIFNTKEFQKGYESDLKGFSPIHDKGIIVKDRKDPKIDFRQKITYDFTSTNQNQSLEKEFDLRQSVKKTSFDKSLHHVKKKEFPEIDMPYRILGVSYTVNCQNFTSVYKKWTYCNATNYYNDKENKSL